MCTHFVRTKHYTQCDVFTTAHEQSLVCTSSAGHTPAQVCYSSKMKQVIPNMMPKKKRPHVVPHGDTFEEIRSIHAMVSQPGGFYTFAKHIQVGTHIPPQPCGEKKTFGWIVIGIW